MGAPTLLVGLGGTGSKIIQKVYKLTTPAQRANISFVVFDTDINELRAISEKTPAIKTVQTSAKLTVGEYLDADRYARDTWFPVNKIMNRKALTEGAGQVRSISRLALNTTIQQGRMKPLEDAITSLYVMSGDKSNQAMRVMLVGSLCGGTGSGLILPVSLYIRNYLKTRLQQGSAIIRGFFILPEVFYKVIPTLPERNNLKCNAYAAVREIDAFLMKGDGSLPEGYDLHYMIPRPGSNEQDDIADSPMDFCFLYDAQNIDGQQLTNFNDYIDHAANCIYAQSIAPTSKRSNSSEDNVIGEVVKAGGRNRFCGAGSSLLEYPVKDVEKYLTLIWARDSISSEWLDVDRDFKKKQKEYLEQKRQGLNVSPVDRKQQYIEGVARGYAERRPFQASVRNMCYQFNENGFMEIQPYWFAYKNSLDKYIAENIERMRKEVKSIEDICSACQQAVMEPSGGEDDSSSLSDNFDSWYVSLQQYRQATRKYTDTLGENLAYSLFKDETDFANTDQDYRIEYWLRQGGNKDVFIHPNAVRFFLSNVLANIEVAKKRLRGSAVASESGEVDGGFGNTKESVEEFWSTFEKKAFDNPDTEEVETASEFYDSSHMNDTGIKRLLHSGAIRDNKEKLANYMAQYYSKTREYWDINVKCTVYDAAFKYISELIRGFDQFYDVLERKVDSLDKNIDELENKYHILDSEAKDGKTVRYVCCDEACLKAISKEVVNLGSSLDIPAELSKDIFTKVKKFAMAETKPRAEKYFGETYEDTILGYYTKSILDSYGSVVCMDVLSALRYEAQVKNSDEDMRDEEMDRYAAHVIDSVQYRARPFIESPMGREPRIIDACTYSNKLEEADVPGRKNFVSVYLKDNGGVDDENIDPSRIVFYKGVYGLRANELSKFAPPKKAETYDRTSGGEYFNAYYERVNQVHPEPRRSRAITPHIDRWWHIISKLPDLDEDNQIEQEYDIDAAFFWGLLGNYISYGREDLRKKVYKINVDEFPSFTSEDEELVVSNGTPCDNFYEVLDAITIFPMVVKAILEKRDNKIDDELNKQIGVKKSYLFRMLEKFRVGEFPINAGPDVDDEEESAIGTCRSIFEIPLLMKRSVPAEEYYEESMIHLMNTILQEIKDYMTRFCNKTEFQKDYAELLMAQYELFSDNVAAEAVESGAIYQDSLFTRICNMVAKELEAQYQEEYAENIRAMLKRKASEQ